MTLRKSSCQRQIEEESDAGAPNFPIRLDHENDTANQGSDDAGAPNLSIGPDHEDGYGDNRSYSPSAYLNLNQDENEEDARNAEYESDDNEEDKGNVEQSSSGHFISITSEAWS
jgi:hypothetical protein